MTLLTIASCPFEKINLSKDRLKSTLVIAATKSPIRLITFKYILFSTKCHFYDAYNIKVNMSLELKIVLLIAVTFLLFFELILFLKLKYFIELQYAYSWNTGSTDSCQRRSYARSNSSAGVMPDSAI